MTQLAAALSHHQAGRLSEAEAIYRQVLAAEPENVDALHLLGVLARQAKRPAVAADLIRRAIDLNDKVADFHNNLGTALLDTGDMAGAMRAFMRALKLRPRYPDAMLNLANLCVREGKDEEAATCYRAVLALNPSNADAASNLGVVLRRQGRLDEAVASYRLAAQLRPDHADAHYNLGNALLAQATPDEAIASYQRAIAVRPNHAESHYNLGNALSAENRVADAAASFARALELRPGYFEASNNLGKALQGLGRHEEAMRCFDAALALAPEHADIHYNRSLLLLLTGRIEEGWAEHEWRWRAAGFTSPRRDFTAPVWDGSQRPDATLLLHAEQGLGDTIQFVRYAAAARARVGRVILEVPLPLLPLMGGVEGVDEIVVAGRKLPFFHAHAPLLTLPHLFGEPAGLAAPYLAADPERVARWAAELGEAGPKVGLVWAGNPKHGNDRNRSLPAAELWPLLAEGRAQLFSLQLPPRSGDLAELGLDETIADLSARLTDFTETAAALAALDLVITVDTSVAHLAGALGRPVWLLLPFAPDWRWGLGSAESRWYPTMRLLRQTQAGDWHAPIAEAASRLGEFADNFI
jgi:tetratricopeptide (TPR) repeat protein